jgi:hypothetical protein
MRFPCSSGRGGARGATVIAAGHLVEGGADAGVAPRLVDAEIADEVGHAHALVHAALISIAGREPAERREGNRIEVGNSDFVMAARIFHRKR